MIRESFTRPVGLLLSGGLDSAILLAHLLRLGHSVQPFYIRSNLVWQGEELSSTRAFLRAIRNGPTRVRDGRGELRDLVVLDLPLEDLYGNHWSITGCETPGAETHDEAVFLPGRNPLLVIKAAFWCALHEIPTLALAPLAANPFADAAEDFFAAYETALNRATIGHDSCGPIQLLRPFAQMSKREVMRLGRDIPLELTFSCIRPVMGRHCGRCNKCAERQRAFRGADLVDSTQYANGVVA